MVKYLHLDQEHTAELIVSIYLHRNSFTGDKKKKKQCEELDVHAISFLTWGLQSP